MSISAGKKGERSKNKTEAKWIENADFRRAEFLAAGEVRKAMYNYPSTPGLNDKTFANTAFSTEGPHFSVRDRIQNTQKISLVPFSVCQPPTSNWHKTSWINCSFVLCFFLSVFMLYVARKRELPRKFARFVLFRPIKKRSFNLLCVLVLFFRTLVVSSVSDFFSLSLSLFEIP